MPGIRRFGRRHPSGLIRTTCDRRCTLAAARDFSRARTAHHVRHGAEHLQVRRARLRCGVREPPRAHLRLRGRPRPLVDRRPRSRARLPLRARDVHGAQDRHRRPSQRRQEHLVQRARREQHRRGAPRVRPPPPTPVPATSRASRCSNRRPTRRLSRTTSPDSRPLSSSARFSRRRPTTPSAPSSLTPASSPSPTTASRPSPPSAAPRTSSPRRWSLWT